MTGNNTKAECSYYRALPAHNMAAFRSHALVTKERMASPLDFTPELQESWTAHPRDRVFGSRTDALSQFAHSKRKTTQAMKTTPHIN
jgi:hypothetical protein